MLHAQQDKVSFSLPGGFYEHSMPLVLTCGEGHHVRYTTNGNTPTSQSASYRDTLMLDESLYSTSDIFRIPSSYEELFYAPDSVQKCITIRAAAFDALGERVGPVVTQSYFIRSLGIDTHGLAVVSLCVDSLDLFDYWTGVYVPGVNYDPTDPEWTGNYYQSGDEWERLANVEFYEPSDNSGINQMAGLRTHGGTARRGTQKGLKLYARKEYGTKRFKHRFFEELPIESYKHLVLKPFASYWFTEGINDDICNRMASQLDIETVTARPVVMFLNGEYWGIYYLKERPDAHFLEDHFGYENDEYNVVSNWYGYQADGDTTGFVAMMDWLALCDPTDPETFARICSMIDVESFIDYYCLELFIANADWPSNNMRCYQHLNGPWRWIFFDGDNGLLFPNFDVFDNATTTLSPGWPTDWQSTLMFRKLLENNGFKEHFFHRFQQLISTQFDYAETKPLYDTVVSLVREEVPQQASRFHLPETMHHWERSIIAIDNFLYNRRDDLEESIESFVDAMQLSATGLKVFPNPAYDQVYVDYYGEALGESEIAIYDVLGRKVYSERVYLDMLTKRFCIYPQLRQGCYLLKIENRMQYLIIQANQP